MSLCLHLHSSLSTPPRSLATSRLSFLPSSLNCPLPLSLPSLPSLLSFFLSFISGNFRPLLYKPDTMSQPSSSYTPPSPPTPQSPHPYHPTLRVKARVGMYELGRTLGQGSFGKVKLAKHTRTGQHFAIKILDKRNISKKKMMEQIKREISTMKLVKHPNIVQLHEVMASKDKVYFVLEYVTGGELLEKIKHNGKLSEREARRYFQQLINGVDYCHSRGVYHRDLKLENLLLDANGDLKITDFGLSALSEQCRSDGLLHTACGTPNYVAPEVICSKGYDGAKADLWSCGVILFVLLAGFLPFEDENLFQLYKKIQKGDYSCPLWFSAGARNLIKGILSPIVKNRLTITQVLEDPWFRKGHKPAELKRDHKIKLNGVDEVVGGSKERFVTEKKNSTVSKPTLLNAFELISLSKGLNLSGLFEIKQVLKQETRFTSNLPASEIISKMEESVKPLGFNVQKHDYKMKLQGSESGRKGHLSIATEVFEVTPSFFVIEVNKAGGDTLEYHTVTLISPTFTLVYKGNSIVR